MKKDILLLHLAILLVLSLSSNIAHAQTSNEVYSDGNVSIVQQQDGWQVKHFDQIVAHGDGILNTQDLPPAFQDFLDYFATLPKDQSPSRKLSKVATTTYGPLLHTQWNQYSPYNDEFPLVDGQRALVGCVNVSTAQILNYYKYCKPFESSGIGIASGTSIESSYISNITTSGTQLIFDHSYPYIEPDFNNMDKTSLSKLLLGIAFANISIFGTEATVSDYMRQEETLNNKFGYTTTSYEIESLTDRSLISSAIKCGRPVIISGDKNGKNGHTFIIDGYNTDDEFHINYGWGGSGDGWFVTTNYPTNNVIIIAYPNDNNVASMQEVPKYLHISGNDISKTIAMVQSDNEILAYHLSEPINLEAGEYEFYYKYADGKLLAPYSASTIALQSTYTNYGRYVTTPAKFELKSNYTIDFHHNVGKGEVKIVLNDEKLDISGKVMDEDGNPLEGACVSASKTIPKEEALNKNDDKFASNLRLYKYTIAFVPTKKYLSKISFAVIKVGTPSNILLEINDEIGCSVWQTDLPDSKINNRKWTDIAIDDMIEVTPGQQYTLTITSGSDDDANCYYHYIGTNEKIVYRIWSTDDIFAQTDQNGNYSLKVPRNTSGTLYAYYDDMKFNTIEYTDITKQAPNQDFKAESKGEDNPDEGEEDIETATENVVANNMKIWSFEKTIFVENGGNEIRIVDMSGRTVKILKINNQRMEIPMQKSGIYIVKTGIKTQKVIIK
ncbi:MAG: C10 family peptidase [Bacteroidales bacterium]|nr:C10 family peptidase [Bacteroidales bacterium]